MGGLVSAKFLVVLVIALVVLGPEKLPDTARTLGRMIGELRRISTGLQAEVRDAFDGSDLAEPIRDLTTPIQELRASTRSWRGVASAWMAPGPTEPVGTGGEAPGLGARLPLDGELGIPPGDPSLN